MTILANMSPSQKAEFQAAIAGVAIARRQVAGRSAFPSSQRNVANTTNTQVQQGHAFDLMDDVSDLVFTYQNAYRSAAGATSVDGLSNVTIRLGLWDGTNTYPLMWPNGSRSMVLEPGAIASTVPLVFKGVKGQRLWLMQFMTWATAPAQFPAATVLAGTATEYSETGTALTDRTSAYAFTYTRQAGTFCVLPPIAITGTPRTSNPVVAILGDSIASDGSADFNTDEPDYGWAQGGLGDAAIPHINLGQSNLQLGQIITSGTPTTQKAMRSKLFAGLVYAGVTHLLIALGTNDWTTSATGAAVYANMVALRDELAPLGIKVIPCTVQPKTTDGNNTAGDANTLVGRPALNALIVANNGVGAGYYDLAGITQGTANTNLWRTDVRTAGSITIANGGTGYVKGDILILPGGAAVVADTVTGGVITSITGPVMSFGGFLTDPAGSVSPVRSIRNPGSGGSADGIFRGAGATFTFGASTAPAPTGDGTHPAAHLTRFIRQDLSAKARALFV